MKQTATFIIRPAAQLVARYRNTSLDSTPFTEPLLWTLETTDRVSWTRQEIVDGVKRLFIAYLRAEVLSSEEASRELEEAAQPEIAFDNGWSLEVFWGVDDRVEDLLLPVRRLQIDSTGNGFLTSMLSYLREQHEQKSR